MQRAAIPRFDADAEPAEQVVVRAKTVVQGRDRRVASILGTDSVAADPKEGVGREAEQQRFHYGHAAKWLDEDVGVCGPATDVESRVALVRTRDRPVLTRSSTALRVLVIGRLVGAITPTDVQPAGEAEAEDTGVSCESESAEERIDGCLLSCRVAFEHHRSLCRQECRRCQGHGDGGANQEE